MPKMESTARIIVKLACCESESESETVSCGNMALAVGRGVDGAQLRGLHTHLVAPWAGDERCSLFCVTQ